MEKNDLIKAAVLFFISFCLLGFIFWNVNKSDRLEKTLLSELDEIAELDNEMCPFDGHLTKTSRVILFDFSDPLPAELNDYPGKLLNNMMSEIQAAERFDRFSLYTLNPYGETPKDINAFCVPVTINQIPGDIRKNLWGKDPQQHSKLPSRYHRFARVFERLWENEHELNTSMKESMSTLASESRNEQSYSRIVENIEEIAGLEIDRGSQEINVIVFSDMLQNSPQYSHYSDNWEFKDYLSKRTHQLLNMDRFAFEVYFVQSCQSLVTKNRRALQNFWEEYFNSSNASVKFKLLRNDGEACRTESPTEIKIADPTTGTELLDDNNMDEKSSVHSKETIKTAQVADEIANKEINNGKDDAEFAASINSTKEDDISGDVNDTTKDVALSQEMVNKIVGRVHDKSELMSRTESSEDNMEEKFTEQNNETGTPVPVVVGMAHKDNSIVNDDVSTSTKKDCPAPKLNKMPTLIYPKRARGKAVLRYRLDLDARGMPVNYELYEIDIGTKRHEKMFIKSAKNYINKLRYEVQVDESCIGGQTAELTIKFD